MAVVQISRIQHRRGLSDDLPQLSSAELGWVINQRKLYIGNGSTVEGAPTIGNTEVLTEHSNILGGASSYTYKGDRAGYTAGSTSARSLQSKLDDFVSVLDFGAKGDGATDDTAAINNALYQLYCVQDTSTVTRRALYFPPGTYLLTTDELKVPAYAHMIGAGQEKTFIKQQTTFKSVIRTADSDQNISASIGTGSAITPRYITLTGMTLWQSQAYDVAIIEQCNEVRFNNVGFKGRLSAGPAAVGSKYACVKLDQTNTHVTSHVVFDGCDFTFSEVGVISDVAHTNVVFESCSFSYLYEAFRIGENIASGQYPKGLRIQNSQFDKITGRALYIFNGKAVTSAFNTYLDCATNLVGAGNPIVPIIEFSQDGNGAFGDWFDRNDADAKTWPRVDHNGKEVYTALADNYIGYGYSKQFPGKKITLTDNQTSAITTGIALDRQVDTGLKICYSISRGVRMRSGTLCITNTTADSSIEDEFVEEADVGVTFTLDRSGSDTKLFYTTNNQGNTADFYYKIERNY
jgi:hypothetical protein